MKKKVLVSAFTLFITTFLSLQAITFTVTNKNNSGVGSLRQAITDANANGTATSSLPHIIDATSIGDTVKLLSILPNINNHIIINGPSSGLPFVISGENSYRVFYILSGKYVTMNYVSIIKGRVTGFNNGGGIANYGTTTLNNCTLSYNYGARYGGAFYNDINAKCSLNYCTLTYNSAPVTGAGAALISDGITTVKNCIIDNNTGAESGGIAGGGSNVPDTIMNTTFNNNISTDTPGGAILINDNGDNLVVINCSFTNNYCNGSIAGNGNGGAICFRGNSLLVQGCTIENNHSLTSSQSGGGIYLETGTATVTNTTFNRNKSPNGGALASKAPNVSISNCTFSTDSATNGGALYLEGGAMTVTNSTFYGNIATTNGGGIYRSAGTLKINNTLIVSNTASSGQDISGTINSDYGHNLIGNITGATLTGTTTGNLTGYAANTVLNTVLANNGGFTKTHALVAGSPAINAGTAIGAPLLDQRGNSRIGLVDIGSYESGILSFTLTPDARFTSSEPGCLGHLENFYSVVSGATNLTHSWNFGSGAIPATSIAQDPVGIVYSTAGAKLVTHIVTDGTTSDTVTNIITINPVPSASFTCTAPVCVGGSINFANTGSSGIGFVYNWDLGDDASPVNSAAQNPVGIEYSTSGTKTITQYITNQFGCTTISVQTITINPLPVADAGFDTTICADAFVQIGSSSIAGNTYSWFPISILNSSIISNPVASPTAANTQFFVTVTNGFGCINHDTVNVAMLPPVKADAGIDVSICKNDSIQVGSSLVQGQTYSWSPVSSLSSAVNPSPIAKPSVTTTYTISAMLYGCGPILDYVTVVVHPLPIANAGIDDSITKGNSTQLVATGGIQYVWNPAFSLSNAGINNPVAHPEITTDYIVTVTDLNNCINYDTVRIYVLEPSYWLPNSFTPGNNGLNDVFFVRGRGIANFEFSVFDRWGEQIFYTKDMTIGWDGTKQGTDLNMPEGAYVYVVRGILSNGNVVDNKGLVNLIR